MVKSNTKKRCKAINRLPVDMLYDGRNSTRNLNWIHRNYVRHLFDVTQETFSSYLDVENEPFDGVKIPAYIVIGLWEMVKVPRSANRLPEDLRRRLASAECRRARYARARRR